MSANDLSVQLWRQRELLEMLLFKYEEERLLLSAGLKRWMSHSAREIEVVVGRLATSSLTTSVELSAVASEWGLPRDARLRELIDAAPDDVWKDIFTAHLVAFVDLITEVRIVRDANDRFMADHEDVAHHGIDIVPDVPATYTARGTADHTIQTARLIDTSL